MPHFLTLTVLHWIPVFTRHYLVPTLLRGNAYGANKWVEVDISFPRSCVGTIDMWIKWSIGVIPVQEIMLGNLAC